MVETEEKVPPGKALEKGLCSYRSTFDRQCFHEALPEDEHCILHSSDRKKDKHRFRDYLERELERQREDHGTMNIEGFVFPVWFNLHDYNLSGVKRINAFRTVFQRGAYFYNFKFLEGVIFSKAIFEDLVDFVEIAFRGEALFENATFKDVASFPNSNFDGEASFAGAVFQAGANFSGVEFTGRARYFETRFEGEANFEFVRFKDHADFTRVNFSAPSYFGNTFFDGNTEFNGALFTALATFEDSAFLAPARFDRAKLNALFTARTQLPWGTSFASTDIAEVEFRGTNIEGCLFSGSVGLDTCRFSHPNFYWRRGRLVVADELELFWPTVFGKLTQQDDKLVDEFPKKKEHEPTLSELRIIRRIYRLLKVNYEGETNFRPAGHFHYGEMEMARAANKQRRKEALLGIRPFGTLLGWYRILSGYGEMASRAIVSFFFVVVLFSAIYSQTGFIVEKPDVGMIAQTKSMQSRTYETTDLYDSVLLSFRVALLRTDAFAQSTSRLATIAMLVETVLGPLTLGGFVLAVRRQFRRN